MIHDTQTQRAQISRKQDGRVPYRLSCALVMITGRAHYFHDYIYITLILVL